MLTWYLAAVPTASQRKAFAALKERRFTIFAPMETVWKSVPKGQRDRVEAPLFPGYVFIGIGPWVQYASLHEIPSLRIIPTTWPQATFASRVADLAFRQCAGEFDKTASSQHYVPPKPMVGPLTQSLGHGLSALDQLKTTDANGRNALLFSGQLMGGGPIVDETQDVAA